MDFVARARTCVRVLFLCVCVRAIGRQGEEGEEDERGEAGEEEEDACNLDRGHLLRATERGGA